VSAARLGELFGTDPIRILECTEIEWMIRLACAKVISNDKEEQERRNKSV
jgi:hypothetical protein